MTKLFSLWLCQLINLLQLFDQSISSYSVNQILSNMRPTQKLSQRISDEGFRKTLPNNFTDQKVSSTQLILASSLRQLIWNLSTQPKHFIQEFVRSKQQKLLTQSSINLNACCSLMELRYIVLGLLETEKQNSNMQELKTTLRPTVLKQQQNKTIYRGKKTNIYIDLDFTEFLDKVQEEISEKQKIIQKLQDMMIDKDNEIDVLQDENSELKRQMEEIGLENIGYQASLQNQKQSIDEKIRQISNQNNKLKGIVEKLNKQVINLQNQNEEDSDQFLRRCLLTQAISIQHFLLSKT